MFLMDRFFDGAFLTFGLEVIIISVLILILLTINIISSINITSTIISITIIMVKLEVIAFAEQDQEDRLDPLIYVFPRMTKVCAHLCISLASVFLWNLYSSCIGYPESF